MKKRILFTASDPYNARLGGVDRVTKVLRSLLEKKGYNTFYYNPSKEDLFEKQREKYLNFVRDNKIDIIINQEGLLESSRVFLSHGIPHVKTVSVLHNDPRSELISLWSFFSEKRYNISFEYIRRLVRICLYPYFYFKTSVRLKRHFEFIGNNSDKVILLSKSFQKYVSRFSIIAAKRTIAIPNPNTYRREEIRLDLKKEKIILYVGRFHNRSKRVDLLLHIWREAAGFIPDWKLVLVGFGPDETALKDLCNSLSLPRVSFVGKREPSEYYRQASVLCLTSRYEGFGMVLTEAQQYGVVPIAFNSYAAVSDIIEHGKTGVLVKPFSVEAYVRSLVDVCTNDERRRLMSENAKSSVRKFDAEIVASQWVKMLESL